MCAGESYLLGKMRPVLWRGASQNSAAKEWEQYPGIEDLGMTQAGLLEAESNFLATLSLLIRPWNLYNKSCEV